MAAFIEMLVFLLILGIGFIYIWARGDLEWIKPKPVIPKLERTIISKESSKIV
jgi:NADH-quinone oxidoreductase subunit A